MDALASGLITLLNGARAMALATLSPVAMAVIICAVSMAWLAMVEVELLNRQGTKPRVGRH
jgi:hypothetical protein